MSRVIHKWRVDDIKNTVNSVECTENSVECEVWRVWTDTVYSLQWRHTVYSQDMQWTVYSVQCKM